MMRTGYQHSGQTSALQLLVPALKKTPGTLPLFLDIGANIGYFSNLAASLGCSVVSVEPLPFHRTLFEASLAINNLSARVVVLPNALVESGGPTSVCMELPDRDNAGFTRVSAGGGCRAVARANTTQVDHLVARHGVPQLVKVDVEGHEMDALRSGLKMFKRNPPEAILLEFNSMTYHARFSSEPHGASTFKAMADELLAFLSDVGHPYRIMDIGASPGLLGFIPSGREHDYLAKPGGDHWNTDLLIIKPSFVMAAEDVGADFATLQPRAR